MKPSLAELEMPWADETELMGLDGTALAYVQEQDVTLVLETQKQPCHSLLHGPVHVQAATSSVQERRNTCAAETAASVYEIVDVAVSGYVVVVVK